MFTKGLLIRATSFADDKPFNVVLESGEGIDDGHTARIYLGRLEPGTVLDGLSDLVALKVFKNNVSRAQAQILHRELRAVRVVRHPHIVPFVGRVEFDFHEIIISP